MGLSLGRGRGNVAGIGGGNSQIVDGLSSSMIGQVWLSKVPPNHAAQLEFGKIYKWADYPILQALLTVSPNPSIVDIGGGLFSLRASRDFLRPTEVAAEIGVHHDDTTAVNGLSGTVADASPDRINRNTRQQGGNAPRNSGEEVDTRDVVLSGDAETAPNWEGVYGGIWGDLDTTAAYPSFIAEQLLLRQIIPEFFASREEIEGFNVGSANPIEENKFSIMGNLENYRSADGRFYFRMIYPDIGEAVEWSQTSNFMDLATPQDTVADFNLIGGGDDTFGGLAYHSATSGRLSWLNGNPNSSNWWWAAGATGIWAGAGGNGMPASLRRSSSSAHVEIYVTVK